jgi:glyoxylase-like metal-dependent hydrolase (beta-lactamase superfamily II)
VAATAANLNRVVVMTMEDYEQQLPRQNRFMKPVPEYHQITNDLFIWHGYNPECKTDCSSTAIRTPDGFVLIDPVRLEEQALERMVGEDGVVSVLLTNGNHLRGSLYEKERLDIPIYAPEGARQNIPADYLVKDGELIFQTLKAIGLSGGSSGETAYLAPDVLVIGDALTNLDGLQILPDKYCTNLALLIESLRGLRSLDFDTVCFAHGLPIIGKASEKVAAIV